MPTVPSTLGLDLSIGPQIAAAEHNNNYAAIQTAVNAIIEILNGGSVGNVLTVGGSGPDWSALSTVGYGTTLPASPTDGQEYVLVDNVQTPTYHWRFRYNSGSNLTHKWEYVGGSPAHVRVDTAEARANTAYGALATAGPSFTVPRAGDWDVEIGYTISNITGTQASGAMSYTVGATAASDNWAAIFVALVASLPKLGAGSRSYRHTGLAANTALVAQYRSPDAADNVTYAHRSMLVTPVRVS